MREFIEIAFIEFIGNFARLAAISTALVLGYSWPPETLQRTSNTIDQR